VVTILLTGNMKQNVGEAFYAVPFLQPIGNCTVNHSVGCKEVTENDGSSLSNF
jgi:hypothetical protein